VIGLRFRRLILSLTGRVHHTRTRKDLLSRNCHFLIIFGRTDRSLSWGSNDPKFTDAAYHSLRFAAGAIGDTAVSTSARTSLPATGGQSLIADLVAQRITGVKGYVDEPLLQAIASPSIVMERFTSGYLMVESFYAASRFVGWEDVVIGDPLLYAPQGLTAHGEGGAKP